MGAYLGQLVRIPGGWSGKTGVVVEAQAGQITVLGRDCRVTKTSGRRCQLIETPPGLTLVRSPAGALLAATRLDLPPAASQELHRRALELAGGSPPGGWRAFAADCAALGRVDAMAGLPLPETERVWWTACAMWTAGQHAEAAAELLKLPAGRYPARLLLWWRAATSGSLPTAMRPAVGSAANTFGPEPPAVVVAVALLLRELGERTDVASDEQLVAAVRTLGGDEVAARLDGQQGESTAARLLGALSGQVGPEQLDADPALPAAAPLPVLDDLIDRGRFPQAWLGSLPATSDGHYLRGRTAIETVDDAQLLELGAHDERARRSIHRGDPLPTDLPPEVAARFALIPAALDADEKALHTVAGAAGLDAGQLRAALADPSGLPAGQLLADESLALLLLGRSTADPADWLELETDPHQRGFAARLALRRAKRLLYTWDWGAALDAARTCLRFTADEALRDEAQNVIAAAQWQLGNDEAASKALSAALDGDYPAALQINYAVVASELEPQQAAAHLSRLVAQAPDLSLRVSAAMQAVRLWRSDQQWQHGDLLPGDLAAALRQLVVEPVEYDVFRDLVRLLAIHDSEWLAGSGALGSSPHQSTSAAQIWTANARGPDEFLRALAQALRGSPEGWVEEVRDQLLRDLLAELTAPGDDQPVGYGVLVLEHRLPMPLTVRAALLALTVPRVCAEIDTTTAEPAGKFLDWLQEAVEEIAGQPEDQGEQLSGLLSQALVALAEAYLNARGHQYEQARLAYYAIRQQLSSVPSGMTVDLHSVRTAVQPGINQCQETIALLERIVQVLTKAGVRQQVPRLNLAVRDLRTKCEQLQQQLHQVGSRS